MDISQKNLGIYKLPTGSLTAILDLINIIGQKQQKTQVKKENLNRNGQTTMNRRQLLYLLLHSGVG